jgi:hypothetical protein
LPPEPPLAVVDPAAPVEPEEPALDVDPLVPPAAMPAVEVVGGVIALAGTPPLSPHAAITNKHPLQTAPCFHIVFTPSSPAISSAAVYRVETAVNNGTSLRSCTARAG